MTNNGDVKLPAPLRKAMEQYSDAKHNMAADLDVEGVRTRVMRLTHQLQKAQTDLENAERPYREAMEEIEPYIEGHGLEIGSNFHHAGVEVKHRAGYTRESYNAAKVKKITNGDKALRRKLKPALVATEVAAKITIQEV